MASKKSRSTINQLTRPRPKTVFWHSFYLSHEAAWIIWRSRTSHVVNNTFCSLKMNKHGPRLRPVDRRTSASAASGVTISLWRLMLAAVEETLCSATDYIESLLRSHDCWNHMYPYAIICQVLCSRSWNHLHWKGVWLHEKSLSRKDWRFYIFCMWTSCLK